jgi:aminoglycoside phosphotransferase (APT) family kinase protein
VHAGNVLAAASGPVLIDFERAQNGPREWDLVTAAVNARRFGGSIEAQQRFSDGYGYDVRDYGGFETLARIRELSATTWLLGLPSSPKVAREAQARLTYWRGDTDPPVWAAV